MRRRLRISDYVNRLFFNAPVAEMYARKYKCPRCGGSVHSWDVFCEACGADFDEQTYRTMKENYERLSNENFLYGAVPILCVLLILVILVLWLRI